MKHGSMTIVLSRFVPIIRTCAPFVAGVARMPYARFQAYNVFGGLAWVLLLVWAGYFFGNIPIIKENFGVVTIGIIVRFPDAAGVGGAQEVSSQYRSFAHRVDIGAPVERVWRAFTDSRVLERWTTAGATRHAARKGPHARAVRRATWSSTRTSTCW